MADEVQSDSRSNTEIAQSILDHMANGMKMKEERKLLDDKIAAARMEQSKQLALLRGRIGSDLISVAGRIMKVGRDWLEEVKIHGQ